MKTPFNGVEMTEKTNQNTTTTNNNTNSQQMTNGQSNGGGGGVLTQAASNKIMEKFRRMEEMESDDEAECPLCMEPLDIDDIDFFPCSCGYQVCRFCWHRLKDEENGLCPACRQSYPELPVHFSAISIERVEEIKKEKRKQKEKSKLKDNNKMANLATIRVVQKNLLFVIGFSARISQDDLRKEFLKYGKIIKMVINPSSAYVTYTRAEDAVMAIKSLNESNCINGKCNSGGPKGTGQTIRASLGTTKYCSHWLRSQVCPKQPDCMYLHENADQDASFTKEQMQLGKHTEYEKRLIAHYTELLRKKEERAMNEKLSRTSSAVDVKEVGEVKKKDSVVSATSNEKKTSSIKIHPSSNMNDDDDADSDSSSSSGNSSLSSSPAQNDVGSTFANYCPSSGVSSLNLCENTSDSLISSSSSGNSSKSSTPDNVQQQAKQQIQQSQQPTTGLQNSSSQPQNVQNNSQQPPQQNGHPEMDTDKVVDADKVVDDDDDDDLDFDPIRFTLDDMLKSMSMESKIQSNGHSGSANTSPQSMRMMMNMNFGAGSNNNNGSNNSSNVNGHSFMGFGALNGGNSFADSFSSYRMQQTQTPNGGSLFGNSNSQSPSLNRLFESATNQRQSSGMDAFLRGPQGPQNAPGSLFMGNNSQQKMLHERELNSFLFNDNSADGFDSVHRQRLFQQQQQQSMGPSMGPSMGQGLGPNMGAMGLGGMGMMKGGNGSGNGMQGMQNSLRQLLPNVNINFRQGCDEPFGGFGPIGPQQPAQQSQQQQHSHPSLSPTSLIAANSFFGPNSSSMRQNAFSSNNSMGSMNGFGGAMGSNSSANSNSANNGMGNGGSAGNSMLAHQQYQQQQQQMMQRYQQQQQQQQQHRNSSLMQQMMAMGGAGNGSGNAFNMGQQQRQQAPPGF